MGNVGLLLVGVVLFVNGLSSLGVLSGRSAAPLNLFVGTAQVVYPTLVLLQAGGDQATINATWPSLLFGFTYLWFGILNLTNIEAKGFGWFSIFVAGIAAYEAIITWSTDPVFAVIWLTWALMWSLFFLLLGLEVTQIGGVDLTRFTGWFLVLLGIPTCTISALFLLNGVWDYSVGAGLAALVTLVVAGIASAALAGKHVPAAAETPVQSAAAV